MNGGKTDAKNDATARSAACFYTMNTKYKAFFMRRHIFADMRIALLDLGL